MQTVKHAVIAAAGMGTRLGLGSPKCLIELGGKPLIAHLLGLLKDVEDVRVVTGFLETEVMKAVCDIRKDVIFVRNPAYRSTTTLTSYAMGAVHLNAPCLFMDADIYFNPVSFAAFLKKCKKNGAPLIAVTEAKTRDAVYIERDRANRVTSFSREPVSNLEWANLAFLHPADLHGSSGAVFEQLSTRLPLSSAEIDSYEIDCPEDIEAVIAAYQHHNRNKC